MPKAGKLIILPLRVSATFPGIPDEIVTLPEVPLPGEVITPIVQPIPSPSPAPGTGVPISSAFAIHDVIGMLPRDMANVPFPATHLKESLTFHWEGADKIPAMDVDATVEYLKTLAQGHINRDWGGGQHGAYIMYHEVIGQNGDSYICHDYEDVVWHCGNEYGNQTSRAILVLCSQATPPTQAQIMAIRKRTSDFKAPVKGHRDWSATECPGAVVYQTVQDLRALGFK